MSKIVVIGANHAGTAAINTILDNYEGNEVVAFDANSNISFLGCGMALWIGNQISGPDGLFYQTKEQFEEKGATIHMETPVDRIDYDAKVVYATGKDGTTYAEPYDKLVLATGSLPIIPRFEGGDLENIQQVKLFQNAQEVVDKLKSPDIKTVAVGSSRRRSSATAARRCSWTWLPPAWQTTSIPSSASLWPRTSRTTASSATSARVLTTLRAQTAR